MQHKSCLNCNYARRVEQAEVIQLECIRPLLTNPPFTAYGMLVLIHDPTFYCSEWKPEASALITPQSAGSQPSADNPIINEAQREFRQSVIDDCLEMTKDVKPLQ